MGQEIIKNPPQSLGIWMESLASSAISAMDERPAVKAARESKDEAILALLAKAALHFWRPDFTAGQARQLYLDYLDALRDFSVRDIKTAIDAHRNNGENRFFPTTGQIIDLIIGVQALENENPGAPDRHRTIARIRGEARAQARKEILEIAAKIEAMSPNGLAAPLSVPLPQAPKAPIVEPPRATKSVAEILREKGFHHAAAKYDAGFNGP